MGGRGSRKVEGDGAHSGMMECSRLTASSSVVILGHFFCLANSGDSKALIAPLPADHTKRIGRVERPKLDTRELISSLPSPPFLSSSTILHPVHELTLEVVDPLAVQQSTPDLGSCLCSEKVDDGPLLGGRLGRCQQTVSPRHLRSSQDQQGGDLTCFLIDQSRSRERQYDIRSKKRVASVLTAVLPS